MRRHLGLPRESSRGTLHPSCWKSGKTSDTQISVYHSHKNRMQANDIVNLVEQLRSLSSGREEGGNPVNLLWEVNFPIDDCHCVTQNLDTSGVTSYWWGFPYWHHQLVFSLYLHQSASCQQDFLQGLYESGPPTHLPLKIRAIWRTLLGLHWRLQKGQSCMRTSRPNDRTPCLGWYNILCA